MTEQEYKRHLLNFLSYSNAYFTAAAEPESKETRQRMAESASHLMGICWCLADYHAAPEQWDIPSSLAWESLGERWEKTMTKWAKRLGANQELAYTRPVQEREALKQWPSADTTVATAAPGGLGAGSNTPELFGATAGENTESASPAGSSTAASGVTNARGAIATAHPTAPQTGDTTVAEYWASGSGATI